VFLFFFLDMQSSSSSSKSKAKSQRLILVRDPSLDLKPPPLPSQWRFGVVLRYIKTSNAVATVTWTDMLNLYVFAISTTVGYSIIDAMRLAKVTAYGMPVVQTSGTGYQSDAFLRIIMNGNAGSSTFGSDRTASDYPGFNGARVSLKPIAPVNDWTNAGGASAAFSVYGSAGVVVDVKLGIQLRGGITGASTALASTGATIGRIYGNYLDSSGTQILQAIGPVNNTLVWV
jgi:hypothetical protein